MWVKVNDRLRTIERGFVKINNTISTISTIFEKKEGVWKKVHFTRLDGAILMYEGDLNNIPNGYVICDGNNGTPDLRGKFILGSDVSGTQGGSMKHTHTISSVSHNHSLSFATHTHTGVWGDTSNIDNQGVQSGDKGLTYSGSHTHTLNSVSHAHSGSTSDAPSIKSYYKLAFIMKVS